MWGKAHPGGCGRDQDPVGGWIMHCHPEKNDVFSETKGRRWKGRNFLNRKIRILVAEEDSNFFKTIEESLRASGTLYYAEKVSSGKECLDKLRTSVLIGGFTMRYIVIYAGQMSQAIAS